MEPDTSSSEVTKRIGDSTAQKLFRVEPVSAGTETAGDFIGCYKLVEPLGEGGFGTVWRAEQHEPIHREVALKVIKLGMDSREIIARFEAERQALALMDHPNIAGVLDAGTTQNGRPYFVMELVKGHAITDYADAHKLTIRQRLELFIPVCQAVQHAHQKAILHRDLKPSNILVAEVDGKPAPKVIDFGIAKALGTSREAALRESLRLTQTGSFVGTPRYMSPEQAGAKADLDTRSDIYTLGVILFELLTGDTPLSEQTMRSAALDEMLRMIRESEPPRPSSRVATATEMVQKSATTRGTEPGRLTRTLRGDLDWITLRALEKDRERRYGSAAALAADIARHLHSEPVEAGPPSALYRFRKLVRRNRIVFASSAIILLLLVAGIALTTWQMFRAQRAEKRADGAAEIAKAVNDFLQNDLLSQAGSRAQADAQAKPNPNLTVREALDRASGSIESRFKAQPLVEAAIQDTIGRAYNDIGDAEKALLHSRRAQKLRTESLGVEHPVALSSWNNVTAALLTQGNGAKAEEELRTLLAIQTRVLGAEHSDTLGSRSNLAIVLNDQGKSAEAEAEHRAMLAIREHILGAEHPETLRSRNNLAVVLGDQGKFAEAEQAHRALVASNTRILGPEHPDTLASRNNLAYVMDAQSKLTEAEAEERALLPIQKRALGPEHPVTLSGWVNLAITLNKEGKFAESEQAHRAILAIRERVLGPEHPDTLRSRSGLANVLGAQSRHAEVEKEHRAVLAIREHTMGVDHPDTLMSRNNLAVAMAAQGKHTEAEQEHRAVLAIREHILGQEHPDTLKSRRNVASSLSAQGKHVLAEREFRSTLAIMERVMGAEHPDVLIGCANLSLCLADQRKFKEALEFMIRAETGWTKLLGPEHPHSKQAKENRERIQVDSLSVAKPEQVTAAPFVPLIVSEAFDYAAHLPVHGMNGGDRWAGPWTGTLATADTASLVTDTFPARGASLLIPANDQEVILSRPIGPLELFADPAQGGTWFFACLLQHGGDLPVPGGDIQINPFNATDAHDLVRIVATDTGGALQLTLNSAANPIEVKDVSKPVLVVLRITLKNPQGGGWDLDAELFVNPPAGTEPPPDARKVTVALKGARLPQQLGLLIRKPRGDATTLIDEIRFFQRFTDLSYQPPAAPVKK